MKSDAPSIELLTDASGEPRYGERWSAAPPARNPKIKVFLLAFLVPCLVGLAITFLRPPIYASNAVLLVEPPESVGRPDTDGLTASGLPPTVASAQYLATERQRLLSEPVLRAVLEALGSLAPAAAEAGAGLATLERMLSVEYAADTNLLELRAEGPQEALLPLLVSQWLESYLAVRAATNSATGDSTHARLETQLAELERRIGEKRMALDRFRREHDIVSQERTENRQLAKLRGLNESINAAEQAEMQAVARLEAIRAAIAAGEPVTQGRDRAAIERLEERIAAMREQIRAQDEQFTQKYLQIAPEMQAARKNLEKAEQDLEAKRREATNEVLAQAEHDVASARANKAALLEQQVALKSSIADFSARFAELESMQQELAQLESEAAVLRERLLRTEVTQTGLFPAVTVLQEASTPNGPVRPHYARDAGISVGAALAFALLVVLVYDYLTRTPAAAPAQPAPVPSILSYSTQVFPPQDLAPALPRQAPVALPNRLPRELSQLEVKALIDAADDHGKVLIGALMSGLSLPETAALAWQQIDASGEVLHVEGSNPRTLPIPHAVRPALARLASRAPKPQGAILSGPDGSPVPTEDLSAMLTYLAHDAGLANPGEVGAESLRHTFLAFLVRQGCRLGELQRVAGAIPPSVLASYASLSPPGPGRPLAGIAIVYPGLDAD